jgi:hypothetical protein
MRRWLIVLIAAAAFASCGGKPGKGGIPPSGLGGVVFDYTGQPLRGVPVSWSDGAGSASALTGPDGRFFLSPWPPSGTHVLKVGDSNATPTLFVPGLGSPEITFLTRPIFVPALDSGTRASVPVVVTVATVVSSDALDAVELQIGVGGTAVTPPSAPAVISLVGVAPSRLPVALPSGLAPRAGYLVEPEGTRFTATTLVLPRLEDTASGPFDLWRLDPATATWTIAGTTTAVDTFTLSAPITDAGLYAVASRAPSPVTVVTGRVLAGVHPVAGYRVEAWNQVSDPTGADGLFTIANVTTAYGAFVLRAYPDRPGIDFAPEVASAFAPTAGNNDVVVQGLPPDSIPPKVVSTTPADQATGQDVRTQVVMKLSEAIDPATFVMSLKGTNGPATGGLIFDAPFQARFIPAQPLTPGDGYSIVLDPGISDLAGNTIDTTKLVFKFTTAAGAPSAPPTDTLAFGMTPLRASAGDKISITGRNFPGGVVVKVGASTAPPVTQTSEGIQVLAPDFEPAADAAVTLASGAQPIATIAPIVLDLRASVAALSSGTLERDAPPAQLVASGKNISGCAVSIDGIDIAVVDTTSTIGAAVVVSGKLATLATPLPSSVMTGPVVARGANGRPGTGYRFIQVRDGP